MNLDRLIEKCDFDFSKATRSIKETVLTVAMVVASSNAMAVDQVNEYLQVEQSSYNESLQIDNSNAEVSRWNYMFERNAPDSAGVDYLDKMEARGVVQTPITFAEYFEVANPNDEQDAKIEVFRNPLSKDGIIVMSTSTFHERMNPFEALFAESKSAPSELNDNFRVSMREEFDEWREVPADLSEFTELRKQMDDRIMEVVGDLDNLNMREKFGSRALRGLTGGYDNRKFEVMGAALAGLRSGIARNPGGSLYFDDGDTKINVQSLYAGGSSVAKWRENMQVLKDTIQDRPDTQQYIVDLIKTDSVSIDWEQVDDISTEDGVQIANAMTLVHEVYHGVLSYSTNSSQPSHMYNAFMQAYNQNQDESRDLSIGKLHIDDMGAYRLNHESACDMAALSIAASGASDAEWEFVKASNEAMRKMSFVDNHLIMKGQEEDYIIDPSKLPDVKGQAVGEFMDADFLANHDVAFLVNGWIDALDSARQGNDPNNLLALANEPLKLGMAVQYANAVVMSDLVDITNDWSSMPKDQYVEFLAVASDRMTEYVQSADFAMVLSELDTAPYEPELNVGLGIDQNLSNDVEANLEVALEVDKPANRSKLTM